MMLKGSREGVAIVIDEAVSIETAIAELRAKLQESGEFFRGAAFRLDAGRRRLTEEEREALSQAVREFGIELHVVDDTPRGGGPVAFPRRERLPQVTAGRAARGRGEEMASEERTLYLRRTLRSGQRVDFDGNVVIMGDVNAGAQITCTGDIIVLGTLRGLAHAGAAGNEEAIVMAFRLEPTQLRIAHYISRAPDEAEPRPVGPEIARVKNDMILIEAYDPR
nr:septum site-determining protein MinC [Bacillota bacterium]